LRASLAGVAKKDDQRECWAHSEGYLCGMFT
jgi:hypothetical protein